MMRVACLVLGYSAPDILRHALPTLRGAGFDTYLHLDRKIDQAAYRKKLGSAEEDVQVLEQRLNIFWGGYRMMQAGLILLEAAHENGPYDRYILISDDSFPVLPAKALRAYLAQQGDCITAVRQPEGNMYHQRYYNFFFYDHPAVTARGERLQEIDEAFEHTIAEIAVLRRIGKKPIQVYFGSQFWTLTQATTSYLLDVVRNDLHLVKSFQYAALPDELMAQSIIGNKLGENRFTAPMFEDFPKGVGPTVFSNLKQIPHLERNFIFIRKIAPDATTFAKQMAERLDSGLTILGAPPEASQEGVLVTNGNGERFINLRLMAPPEKRPGWHDEETYLGRSFRWTYHQKLEWTLEVVASETPLELRFFLPLVIADRPLIYENCYLGVNDLPSKRLTFGGGGLNGVVLYSGDGRLTVRVTTPPPVTPLDEGGADSRRLGLSVVIGR